MNQKPEKQWVVYIIETQSGKLYTGITNQLEQRFNAHQTKQKGARFFYFSEPSKIVYTEPHPNRSEASKRESTIKKMARSDKLLLIKLVNNAIAERS
jgi:putative endonuclease